MTNLELGKKRAEELGLTRGPFSNSHLYLADDIHKLLGEGVWSKGRIHKDGEWTFGGYLDEAVTHKALLIGIRPIVQESEERKLLRELVNNILDNYDSWKAPPAADLVQKAKRLLDGEK